MIDQNPIRIEDNTLLFGDAEEMPERIEGHLRYHYSRRLFVQNITPVEGGYSVRIGIVYPRDVSDYRRKDNVLKMVNIGDVYTLQAVQKEDGHYEMKLPERSDVYKSFQEQRKKLLNQLDGSMAATIYEKVYEKSPVRTQLNAVVELIDYVRNDGPLSVARLEGIQSTGNTREYIDALEDLGFLSVDESDTVHSGGKMDAADDRGWNDDELIGQVVKDGYPVLRQKFGLTMLNHFPTFANGYYLSAFRRKDRDLYLSKEDVVENLRTEYQRNTDPLKVDRKLKILDETGVVEYKDDEVSGVGEVYDEVNKSLPAVG